MRTDLVERAIIQALPARALRQAERMRARSAATPKPLQNRIRSNTTIMTMKYAGGILCAADRKTSGWGYTIMSQESIKIYPVAPNTVILGCGSVSSIQLVEATLKEANHEFFEGYEFLLSVKGQVNYLAQLLRWWSFWYGEFFSVGVLLAGVDPDGTFIYELEEDGCNLERPHFATSGSGGFRVEDQLDARWEEGLSLSDALEIAMHGMVHSGMRDSGSSDPRIALPTVVTVTEGGVEFLSERAVKAALAKVLRTKRGSINRAFARALLDSKEE